MGQGAAAGWSTADLRTHEAELRAAARHICRDPMEREDLIQDTFERGLRYLRSGNPAPRNMRVWLVSILRNAFIDRTRRTAVAFEELGEHSAPLEHEPPAWSDVSLDEVRAALAELEPELRVPFEMHYIAQVRYREIAEQLRIPSNTVATRLLRARKLLRQILLRDRGGEGSVR